MGRVGKIDRVLDLRVGEPTGSRAHQKIVNCLFGFTPQEARDVSQPENGTASDIAKDARGDPRCDSVLKIDSGLRGCTATAGLLRIAIHLRHFDHA